MSGFKIAVDGPAGAGKSTAARLVAGRLGYTYLDTGAMYRALTLKALRTGNLENPHWKELVESTNLEIITETAQEGIRNRVLLDGEDVTEAIRTPEINRLVSVIAAVDEVRYHLVGLQRKMAASGRIVMDGRDIGTVVLPDADKKFFLTASLMERAKRRQAELAKYGFREDLGRLVEQIRQRDLLDSTRETGPLRMAHDAVLIDTTSMEIEQVVELMLAEIRRGEAHCFTR